MKILFAGQLGLPLGSKTGANDREWRALNLAQTMVKGGHETTITGTQEYLPKHLRNLNGINLKRLMSLNPEKPGGRLYRAFSAWEAWRGRYDAVHAQGAAFGTWLHLLARLRPGMMLIWTVDRLPVSSKERERMIKMADKAEITVTNRQLQQNLLIMAGIKAKYVPDGYNEPGTGAVPASQWGLRPEQYILTTETEAKGLRLLARAYKKAGSRKKLVVLKEAKGYLKRLEKEFPGLVFVGEARGRSLRSLIEQAHMIVLAGNEIQPETVLWTMEARRMIVAMAEPTLEELLGVTARFVAKGDEVDLAAAIKSMVNSGKKQAHWGAKARRRARQHFSWVRIVEEYRLLYADQVQRVSLDSARGRVLVESR